MTNDRFRFRAWHKPTKKLFDVFYFTDEIVFENILDGVGTFPTNPAKLADCVLEQCTGLKDKHGKLIYEGDIIKTVLGRIVEVKFGKTGYNSEFTFCAVGFFLELKVFWGEDYINFRETPYYEVIGNIHENPELLEGHNDER